jgi:hypothetical protein
MNIMVNIVPMFALVMAQFSGVDTKLEVYGPMGAICLWLMWRDEKRAKEAEEHKESDRKENEKTREEIKNVAHQMKGLSRSLLYVTATHGPAGLRTVAEKELERVNACETNPPQ